MYKKYLLVQLDNVVEEVVCPLDLIPEEEVGLAELELLEVVGLHEGDPHGVEAREEPTTSGLFLIRQRFDFVDLKI